MSLPTQEPELRPDPTGVSYSDHDPQESGAAGFGRDDGDDDSLGVEFVSNVLYVLRGLEAPVVLFASIIYNVWLPYRHGLPFRVPPSAAIVVALDAGRGNRIDRAGTVVGVGKELCECVGTEPVVMNVKSQ